MSGHVSLGAGVEGDCAGLHQLEGHRGIAALRQGGARTYTPAVFARHFPCLSEGNIAQRTESHVTAPACDGIAVHPALAAAGRHLQPEAFTVAIPARLSQAAHL